MSEIERVFWLAVQADYKHAHAIASAIWGPSAPPEVIQAATATVLIHAKDLRQRGNGNSPPAAAPVEPSPSCECGTVMAPVEKKNPKMPDWRCPKCDKALWNRDRKRPRTATT